MVECPCWEDAIKYLILIFVLTMIGCQKEPREGVSVDIQKDIPELSNVATVVQQHDSFQLCDRTLLSSIARQSLAESYGCREDFELEDFIGQKSSNCLQFALISKGRYSISNLSDETMVLVRQAVSTQGNFDTTFKITPIYKGLDLNIDIALGTKLLTFTHGKIVNCKDNYPATRGYRTEFGKITRPYYNIKPLEVPFGRKTYISQCYMGEYSHFNSYALDFGANEGEEVLNTKPGVVLFKMTGSKVHCKSRVDSFGDKYWKIFKDHAQMSSDLRPCPSCVYYSFPEVCRSSDSANRVLMWHTDNSYSWYNHLEAQNELVEMGDVVDARTPIGTIGWSGWVAGLHLHLEVLEMQLNSTGYSFNTLPTYFSTSSGAIYPCENGTLIRPANQ